MSLLGTGSRWPPCSTTGSPSSTRAIGLKAGRYIRVRRETRFPNKREEFELLKKFADFHFSSEFNETATLDDQEYVGVYVYEDTLSFINHNRPLPPVTIEDMNTQEEFRDREYLNPEIKEMFFALDLIQSYGSGIRRAKHATADNGNPPLLFEPLNDTDDYTMVTCPINEEFAYIRDHEDVASRKSSEITASNVQEITERKDEETQTTDSSSEKTSEKIMNYLRRYPKASAKEMAASFGLSQRAVEYQLRGLRQAGVIRRVGPAKGGSWMVIDKEHDDA